MAAYIKEVDLNRDDLTKNKAIDARRLSVYFVNGMVNIYKHNTNKEDETNYETYRKWFTSPFERQTILDEEVQVKRMLAEFDKKYATYSNLPCFALFNKCAANYTDYLSSKSNKVLDFDAFMRVFMNGDQLKNVASIPKVGSSEYDNVNTALETLVVEAREAKPAAEMAPTF